MTAAIFPDKAVRPDPGTMLDSLGPEGRQRWKRLVAWARETYEVDGEPNFFGRTTGWTLRFRRAGKTLFTLIPRASGLAAIVVIGPGAWGGTDRLELTDATRDVLSATMPYPDGRWAWLEITDDGAEADLMQLVVHKAPPPTRRRHHASRVAKTD